MEEGQCGKKVDLKLTPVRESLRKGNLALSRWKVVKIQVREARKSSMPVRVQGNN